MLLVEARATAASHSINLRGTESHVLLEDSDM